MFENIIGNDEIKKMLSESVENNMATHSYLFVGISGIGKKMIAKEFAKMLLCNGENKYCNSCKSCVEFDSNNNPDFMCIEPQESTIKIDQIRYLQKKIQEKPIISNNKVYIIDDADCMTTEAQNCLLKTLEEPPQFATIILIGSNESLFLPTIRSRCMIVNFRPLNNEQIKEFLRTHYNMENINENTLDMFEGSIGRAISLKDKQEEYKSIQDVIENIDKRDIIDIVNLADPIYKGKDEIFDILDYINIILLKKAKKQHIYANCIDIVENTKKRLKQNANYDMSIDNMLFKIWEEVN